MLMTATTDAAQVSDNALLYVQTERERRRLQAICDVSRRLAAVHDADETLSLIVHEAEQLLGAEAAAIRLLEGDDLVLKARTESAASFTTRPRVRRGESLSGIVVATGEPVEVEDLAEDERYDPVHRRAAAEHGFHGFLGVPLRASDRILGALNVFTKVRRRFEADEISLLCAFADQASLAIEKAALLTATRAQAATLAQKNAELGSFVYIVSHDLKAPLVSIQGMSGLLLDEWGAELGVAGRHYLERIAANIHQMERLIASLLVLSGVGREKRRPEMVCLDTLIEDLVTELGEPIRALGITVIARNLGVLCSVRSEIEQVFGHLVSNAITYLGASASPTVEIGTADRGEFIECSVKDNGIGIDAQYHERIFEIFQRLKEVDGEGAGVGLAIVRKIVEAAGGCVWVESAKGHGATFRFTWPKRPDHPEAYALDDQRPS
jgi:signal transduction histidine kinase